MTLRDDLVMMLENENDDLRMRCKRLEEMVGFRLEAPPQLGLTGSEAKVFGALLKNGPMRKDQLMDAVYWESHEEPEIKIVDVYICKIRAKLKRYRIEIETIWGQGYVMPAASKVIAQALIDEYNPPARSGAAA